MHDLIKLGPRATSGANLDRSILSNVLWWCGTTRLDSVGNNYINGGNVGIGTTSPNSKLHSQVNESTFTYALQVDNANAAGAGVGIGFYQNNGRHAALKNYWVSEWKFGIDVGTNLDVLTLTTAGKVGIGTTSPGTTLDVSGTLNVSQYIVSSTYMATTEFKPNVNDGAVLGTSSSGFSDLYLADGGVIYLGNDQDTTITHNPDTGITLNNNLTATGSVTASAITSNTGNNFSNIRLFGDNGTNGDSFRLTLNNDNTLLLQRSADQFSSASSITKFEQSGNTCFSDNVSVGSLSVRGGHVTLPGNLVVTACIGAANFKQAGTNFVDSILVGTNTTGTLDTATCNVGVGVLALSSITSGCENVVMGHKTGHCITTARQNTFLGHHSGCLTSTGFANTAIGTRAMASNTTGNRNIAIGYRALAANVCCADNIVIGHQALEQVSQSKSHIAIGNSVMRSADAGSEYNIGIGGQCSYVLIQQVVIMLPLVMVLCLMLQQLLIMLQ